MVLEESTIQEIKDKSGLEFNKVKDFVALSDIILKTTGRSIGVTTLKRLMGNHRHPQSQSLYLGHHRPISRSPLLEQL